MCDRAGYYGKKSPSGKNDQKWSKMVFRFFKEITSLVLSGICVKRNFLWFINILWKLHSWEKSGSQIIAKKWFSTNEMSVFFNRQYFINRWIPDFDLWHVDRLEWKEQGLLTGFLKKFSFGQMGYFGPKNDASS